MVQSVKIAAITGNSSEIQDLLFWPCADRFAELCAKVIAQQNYLLEMPVLYALCSWIMQLMINPGNKQLAKNFILEEFFAPGHSLQLFSLLLDDAYQLVGQHKDESKYPGYFKRYRTFVEKLATLLAQRQLEIHTFERLLRFHLITQKQKNPYRLQYNRVRCIG